MIAVAHDADDCLDEGPLGVGAAGAAIIDRALAGDGRWQGNRGNGFARGQRVVAAAIVAVTEDAGDRTVGLDDDGGIVFLVS